MPRTFTTRTNALKALKDFSSEAVQHAKELITEDHDVLNLASKLTQFIGLTRVFSNPDYTSYEIVCYHAEDYDKLKKYLVPADAN